MKLIIILPSSLIRIGVKKFNYFEQQTYDETKFI